MTGPELKALGLEVMGYGWQRKMAALLDVHEMTISAWVRGKTPIDRRDEIAIMWVLSQEAEKQEAEG